MDAKVGVSRNGFFVNKAPVFVNSKAQESVTLSATEVE
jgi:hypothetical protein